MSFKRENICEKEPSNRELLGYILELQVLQNKTLHEVQQMSTTLTQAVSDLLTAETNETTVITNAIAALKDPTVDNSAAIAAIETAVSNINTNAANLQAALPQAPADPVDVVPPVTTNQTAQVAQ